MHEPFRLYIMPLSVAHALLLLILKTDVTCAFIHSFPSGLYFFPTAIFQIIYTLFKRVYSILYTNIWVWLMRMTRWERERVRGHAAAYNISSTQENASMPVFSIFILWRYVYRVWYFRCVCKSNIFIRTSFAYIMLCIISYIYNCMRNRLFTFHICLTIECNTHLSRFNFRLAHVV